MTVNKTATIILAIALGLALLVILVPGLTGGNRETEEAGSNVVVKDGVQYITLNAKGGYQPRLSTAKAGMPSKLIVKTNGTYDCSLALVIAELGYKKILPATSEEVIDLGAREAGSSLRGTCSMGMYSFQVDFI